MPYSEIRIVASSCLAHFKNTLRPYFVKGVNHVFLWRFLQMFRAYRGQNEFVHWIVRFEIAQKRVLASWADLLDLSDLPDVTPISRNHHMYKHCPGSSETKLIFGR
jgi:hypothetical protein